MMSLEARNKKFYLDGKEIVLLSGAVHYFRVVPGYWEDRLLRLKACGLNCVETYVPWNWHEEVKGSFNFEGILDIRRFIELAQEVGLHVLLRPGPYICSEWDFGGLPSWLLSDPDMKVRSSYKPYLEAVDRYFAKLLPLVEDLQRSKGGPIIAMQIENEYGSYGDDMEYKMFLKETMQKYGVVELLFTSDNGMGIQKGNVPDTLITANFQEIDHGYLMYEYLEHIKQPDMPLMVMEFWSGWFDHWGEKHHVWPVQDMEKVLRWILEQGSSLNLYMFHGGTNFGFMNGANQDLGATNEGGGSEPYMPDVTSYDYDAPVAENGDLMPKWFKIRELLLKTFPSQVSSLPDPPAPIESFAYGEVQISSHLPFTSVINAIKPIESKVLLPMESLDINNGGGQGYGFILYRTTIGKADCVRIVGRVNDRAVVYVNGAEVDVVDWAEEDYNIDVNTAAGEHQLDLLVENCGRVNYADFQSPVMNMQRKGVYEDVVVDGYTPENWTIYPIELKRDYIESIDKCNEWVDGAGQASSPTLSRAVLNIEGQPKDTFLNMKDWGRGVVFVNGFNLGRYFNIGPTLTLYVPAPLLKEGENIVHVFELQMPASQVIFQKKPILGETVVHSTVLPFWVKVMIYTLKNTLSLGGWVWPIIRLFMK